MNLFKQSSETDYCSRCLVWIILLSFCLNVPGISWGLPNTIGWAADELVPSKVMHGLNHWFSGGWRTQYPPLHFYLLALTYSPFLFVNKLYSIPELETSVLFYAGRSLSLAMAVGLLIVVYRIGCELYDKRTALYPVLIMALSPVIVYYSKIANLDIPLLFWFSLSLLYLLKLLKDHRLKYYLLFTVTATFALCTKDQAYAVYAPIPLMVIFSHYVFSKNLDTEPSLLRSTINHRNVLSLLLG